MRFTLRHLLGLTALIAVCLVWPILVYFVVPLVFVAILSRFGYGSVVAMIGMIVGALLLGITLSMSYWRYPFAQPRLLNELRQIVSVEQLCEVANLNAQRRAAPSIQPLAAIPPRNALSWNTSTEVSARQRILVDLGHRSVPVTSSLRMSDDVANSIWRAADQAGILVDGEPGYPDTKCLWGYIGKALLSDAREVFFATLDGDQESNDHYPYYEIVLQANGDHFEIVDHQWFYEDIAGMEGFNWIAFSVLAFIFLLAPLAIAFGIIRGIWRAIVRRRMRSGTETAISPETEPAIAD